MFANAWCCFFSENKNNPYSTTTSYHSVKQLGEFASTTAVSK